MKIEGYFYDLATSKHRLCFNCIMFNVSRIPGILIHNFKIMSALSLTYAFLKCYLHGNKKEYKGEKVKVGHLLNYYTNLKVESNKCRLLPNHLRNVI